MIFMLHFTLRATNLVLDFNPTKREPALRQRANPWENEQPIKVDGDRLGVFYQAESIFALPVHGSGNLNLLRAEEKKRPQTLLFF